MDKRLFFKALTKLISGFLALGLLLFLPAGTFNYPNAWLLLAVLFIPMLILGAVLLVKAPELLRKRLNSKEEQSEQKLVILLSLFMFVGGFVLAGLDFRFRWLPLPRMLSYIAAVLFLMGYALYAEVMRENAWLSRTVEVQEGQKVISSGLYGMVRHPMYSSTILLFLSMPLVLGSLISFALFLVYPLIIAKRIKNEETLLEAELEGYSEYKQKVKYRLIPFVW